MSDIETHCLYGRSYGVLSVLLIIVLGEEYLVVIQFNYLVIALPDILRGVGL